MRYIVAIIIFCLSAAVMVPDASARRRTKGRTATTTAKKSPSQRKAKEVRSARTVKSERKNTLNEIAQTKNKIDRTQKETRKNLEALEGINAGIERQEGEISALNAHIDSIGGAVAVLSDSVSVLEGRVATIRAELKKALRNQRARRKTVNDVAFVFSSPSFNAARRRINYIRQTNRWRASRIKALREDMASLNERRARLQGLQDERTAAVSRLNASRQVLVSQREERESTVEKLRGQTRNLNAILAAKNRKLSELDRELDRIIALEEARRAEEERQARIRADKARKAEAERRAEAARKEKESSKNKKKDTKKDSKDTEKTVDQERAQAAPEPPREEKNRKTTVEPVTGIAEADRKITGSFEANRGRLLFPVAGKYSIVGNFGRSSHANISTAQVNNSGIDISVAPGTTVRAAYEGTVSSIFFMPGYNNIVIVRHGRYLTVYAGLTGLTVKKGSKVKTGGAIGRVAADDSEPDRGILHFEVRREREKLNPLQWVR